MQPIADLLALWSAVAAAARRPGRLRVIAATTGHAPDHWLHPVPTVVVGLLGVVRIAPPGLAPVDLAPGDAVVIASGAAHSHAPLRRRTAALELGFEYGWCDIELHDAATAVGAVMPRQPAEALVQRMLGGDAAALAGLLALLIERPWQDVQRLPDSARRMRDRIRSHGLTAITAADIARASGLRPSRAWQVFRRHFGCTPRQALEQRRCAVAAALLEQGLAVATVAIRCGFADRGTFARAFARVHGRTPGRRR